MSFVGEEESLDTHADTEQSIDYESGVDEFGHSYGCTWIKVRGSSASASEPASYSSSDGENKDIKFIWDQPA